MKRPLFAAALFVASAITTIAGAQAQQLDEAAAAGRSAKSLPIATEDYFHDMDNGVALSPLEVAGRDTWIMWSGGNDRFWDSMTGFTFGAFDLLKIVSYDPTKATSKADRDNRWTSLGLINEPCFDAPTDADPNRFGLKLDVRQANCPADPFENETKYPGIVTGSRGKDLPKWGKMPIGSLYGSPTGIVGLRLYPNPAFDAAAAQHWDPVKYFTDPSYYNDKNLVRPYRVGMSCGFCHVGPSPIHPPADPANPQWSNLSSTVGAQYMQVDKLFIYDQSKDNFMFQLVHTYRPGSMDTSLVSTDNINNARTMNAVYSLGARLEDALRWGKESLVGGERNNKQFDDYDQTYASLYKYFKGPGTTWTPRVLKDGSDSVGVLGALNRVYINIGLYSEEWLKHFNPVVGGKPISPIEIAVAEKNSSYWKATEAWTPATAAFFLKAAQPDRLADAPGGKDFLTEDAATIDRGKTVFAETCARCHSSKAPTPAKGLDPSGCAGPDYMKCWNAYWAWTKTDDYKTQMNAIVHKADFLDGNYLSTDLRVPVTLLGTNACSPLATNALAGNIWDNFSSHSYKSLPSVGDITWYDPFTGEPHQYTMPAGGRGYTRPPSLVSVWNSAPFLLNNALGDYNADPSVKGRMAAFDSAITQLLWPEKREKDPVLGDKVPGVIDRTTTRSWIHIPPGYAPSILRASSGLLSTLDSKLFDADGGITIGPIPKGVPVGMLANLQPLAETHDPIKIAKHVADLAALLVKLKLDLATLPADATDDQVMAKFSNLKSTMLSLDKCTDFVVNRGHYFGTDMAKGGETPLSDDDKKALIAFLKTF